MKIRRVDHRFLWSAGYEPRASGARLTSGYEKPPYDCEAGWHPARRLCTGAVVGPGHFFEGARLRSSLLLAFAALLTSSAAAAGPQPPCGSEPSPAYPAVDQPPVIETWEKSQDWKPPQCTGWEEPGYSTLVAIVARFHSAAGRDGLLRLIGAISELKDLRYWSTTHQQWRTLIVNASALSGDQHRRDFSPEELTEGTRITFEREDSLSGKGVYEMRVLSSTPDRLVINTANLSTLRFLMLPIFRPGEVQSIYFLEREPKDVWRYYNLARTGRNANSLTAGHAASSVNRAVALYRHLAGIPADKEPPAAR